MANDVVIGSLQINGVDKMNKQLQTTEKIATEVVKDVQELNKELTNDKPKKQQESLRAEMRRIQAEIVQARLAGREADQEQLKRLSDIKDAMGDVAEEAKLIDPEQRFKALIGLGSSIAGVYAGATAAAGLFGSSQEDLQKQILKVQQAMALLQAVQSLYDARRSVEILKQIAGQNKMVTAIMRVTGVQKILNFVASANPWTFVLTTVMAIVGAFVVFANWGDKIKKAFEPVVELFDYLGDKLRDLGSWLTGGLIDDAATAKTQANIGKILDSVDAVLEANDKNLKFVEDQLSVLKAMGVNELDLAKKRKDMLADYDTATKLKQDELVNARDLANTEDARIKLQEKINALSEKLTDIQQAQKLNEIEISKLLSERPFLIEQAGLKTNKLLAENEQNLQKAHRIQIDIYNSELRRNAELTKIAQANNDDLRVAELKLAKQEILNKKAAEYLAIVQKNIEAIQAPLFEIKLDVVPTLNLDMPEVQDEVQAGFDSLQMLFGKSGLLLGTMFSDEFVSSIGKNISESGANALKEALLGFSQTMMQLSQTLFQNAIALGEQELEIARTNLQQIDQEIQTQAKRSQDLQKQLETAQGANLTRIQERLRLQAEQEAQLEAQRRKAHEEEKKRAKELEALRKRQMVANKAAAITQATINGALAITKVLADATITSGLSLVLVPLIAATTAAQIATIAAQKMAKGGIIKGNKHATGGVMAGGAEVEGGEMILTSTVSKRPELARQVSAINQRAGGSPIADPVQAPQADPVLEIAKAVMALSQRPSQVEVKEIIAVAESRQEAMSRVRVA